MKIQNKKTKVLTRMSTLLIAILVIVSISPAFATSSTKFGSYSPLYASPSGSCSGSLGQTCGSASSSGADLLYSTHAYPGSNTAIADNNYNPNNTPPYGSTPTINSLGPYIWFNNNVSWGYDIINPSNNGNYAYYEIEPFLFDSATGGAVKSCQHYESTVGINSGTNTVTCMYTNSFLDQYYVGAANFAYAAGSTSGSSTVNMWNTNNGYKITVNSLTVCDDGTC